MDKLPAEILRKVFIHLSLEERIKYTLVCRKWWLVLDKYCLLYNVGIYNDVNKFNRFMEMVKQSPHHANQVHKLRLRNSFDHDFNKRELCNFFPNVREMKLEWTGNEKEADEYTYFEEPIEMTHSSSKLEYLHDSIYCEFALQMLISNLCSQLVELELDFHGRDGSSERILSELKDLPLLKKLTLARLYIETNDLEILHANLPTIQDFRLDHIYLLLSEYPRNIVPKESPHKIVPVDSITHFFVYLYDNYEMESHCEFYRYMTKKYANVAHFDYMDETLAFSDSSYAEQLYKNGGLDFLRLIGPKTIKLDIPNVPDRVDVFAELDSVESKIEELHISNLESEAAFEYLSRSNQSKYVKKLKISNSLIRAPDCLKTMMALTAIEIVDRFDPYGSSLELDEYLNACPPSVKKFTVSGFYLEMKRFVTRPSSIEILEIEHPEINRQLEDVISTCFPKLIELRLIGELSDDVSIVLRSRSLKYVEFRTERNVSHGFRVKCRDMAEPQYYICTKEKKPILSTLEEIKSKRILSLTTFSRLKMHNGVKIRPLLKRLGM